MNAIEQLRAELEGAAQARMAVDYIESRIAAKLLLAELAEIAANSPRLAAVEWQVEYDEDGDEYVTLDAVWENDEDDHAHDQILDLMPYSKDAVRLAAGANDDPPLPQASSRISRERILKGMPEVRP